MGTALIIAPFVLGGIVGASVAVWYTRQLPAPVKTEVVASGQYPTQQETQPVWSSMFDYRSESLEDPLREYILGVITTSTNVTHRSVEASSGASEPPKVLLDNKDQLLHVSVGKPFTLGAGCSNMSSESQYTINNVSIDSYGRWSMTLTEQTVVTSRFDERTGTWKEDRGPFPSRERVLNQSSFNETNYGSEDPVIYESNGVYEPIYVSPKEVFFFYTQTSC